MRNFILCFLVFTLGFGLSAMAQVDEEPYATKDLTSLPAFPGGKEAYFKFLDKELVYPESAKARKLNGSVFYQLRLNAKGEIVEAIQTLSMFPEFEEEAARLIGLLPNFIPAEINKEAVPCLHMLAIPFKYKEGE